jgi:hypothetical protein
VVTTSRAKGMNTIGWHCSKKTHDRLAGGFVVAAAGGVS